jgi:hypothetical protein
VIASGHELVTRLLDVTPVPASDANIDQLLAAFDTIHAERAAILADAPTPITLSDTDRPLLAELERRQNIWQDALAAALRRVGDHRCGTAQLRAYGGPR